MFDSTIGFLESKVVGKTTVDGRQGLAFESRLALNYRIHQSQLLYDITSRRWIDQSGAFLGDSMQLKINSADERLLLKRKGEKLVGFVTRGGNPVAMSIDFPFGGFAIDDNFFDQYELMLAMRTLRVGDSLVDTVFSPQSMLPVVLRGSIESRVSLDLGRGKSDSAYVVYLVEPQAHLIYFTSDKRIAMVEIPQQNIRVLQQGMPLRSSSRPSDTGLAVVNRTVRVTDQGPDGQVAQVDTVPRRQQSGSPSPTNQPAAKPFSRPNVPLTAFLTQYLTFVLVGFLAFTLFVGRGYKWAATYIAGLLGLLAFALMPVSQSPLQMYLIEKFFAPQVQTGASPFLWAFVPAIGVALVQEIIKGLAIFAIIYRGALKDYQFSIIGAAIGATFGIAEACYVVTQIASPELFSAVLLERIFILVYHVAAGAILGAALRYNVEVGIYTVIGLVVGNAMFRYIPVFVQFQVFEAQLLAIVMAFLSLAILTLALIAIKRVPQATRGKQSIAADDDADSAS